MARKFPDPKERSAKHPAVLCDNNRVVKLYNKATGESRTSVAKKVKQWFIETAKAEGWDAAVFMNNAESTKSAGCVLYKSFNTTTTTVLVGVFITGDDEDEKEDS